MQEKKRTIDELLVTKVIDQIANCELLDDEKKIQALDDIIDMLKDQAYFKQVEFEFVHIQPKYETLGGLFLWDRSKLGTSFWSNMYDILNG